MTNKQKLRIKFLKWLSEYEYIVAFEKPENGNVLFEKLFSRVYKEFRKYENKKNLENRVRKTK